jgi:hypothetical protein
MEKEVHRIMEKGEIDAEVSRLTQELFDLETEKKEYNKEMNFRIKALKNAIKSAIRGETHGRDSW